MVFIVIVQTPVVETANATSEGTFKKTGARALRQKQKNKKTLQKHKCSMRTQT